MTRRMADMMGLNVKDNQMHGIVGLRTLGGTFWRRVGSDTIDFRFSAESPSLLSVAHTVSAECDTSLSAYFRSRPKVEFSLSVDLYSIPLLAAQESSFVLHNLFAIAY